MVIRSVFGKNTPKSYGPPLLLVLFYVARVCVLTSPLEKKSDPLIGVIDDQNKRDNEKIPNALTVRVIFLPASSLVQVNTETPPKLTPYVIFGEHT